MFSMFSHLTHALPKSKFSVTIHQSEQISSTAKKQHK